MTPSFCFILTTHITDPITSQYWWECCRCIRSHYTEPIYVINDSSDPSYAIDVDNFSDCHLIQSEFPNKAEILPYYYLYTWRLADRACILHDTTFVQNRIDFHTVTDVRFLWHFTHKNERRAQIYSMIINGLDNHGRLLRRFTTDEWNGCFGVQSVMTLSFLDRLVEKYNLFKLMSLVTDRSSRKALERVFAIACYEECHALRMNPSLCGHIFYNNIRWKFTFSEYGRLRESIRKRHQMIKCFTGR